MNKTYEVVLANSFILEVEQKSNKIIFEKSTDEVGRYTKEYSKAILSSASLIKNYKNSYKGVFLDPTLKTGASSSLLEFKAWQSLYLNDPPKGKIAPWTKKEKAYYESLKTKKERYKYLVIRSGLRPAIMDVPYDAIGGVDDDGRVINPEYEEFFYLANLNSKKAAIYFSDYLEIGEWNLLKGFLGDKNAFIKVGSTGWTARAWQCIFLQAQLGDKEAFRNLAYLILCSNSLITGLHWNKIRAQRIYKLYDNHKYLLDSFGMIPYLDELIGVEWVIDFNCMYGWAVDPQAQGVISKIYDLVDKGELKDPRDKDSTSESRIEFMQVADLYIARHIRLAGWKYAHDIPNSTSLAEAKAHIRDLSLEAKILSVTLIKAILMLQATTPLSI